MKTVKLGDLPIKWMRGAGLRKSDVNSDGKNECVLYGELFTKYKNVIIEKELLSKTDAVSSISSKIGDVLVPGTSTAARSEMIRARAIDADKVLIGGDINIIRPENGLFDAKYLAYFFETDSAHKQLERYITGTTGIIHISNTGIKNLEVPLVSIEEQQLMVEQLDAAFDKIDRAIELTEKKLSKLKEMKESLLEQTFSHSGVE